MRRPCWLEGPAPFYTRQTISVVDASLMLRGLSAIPSNSEFNQIWFSREPENFLLSVGLQKALKTAIP